MFRIKIDPRTVMTMQNQIPKVVIALVLITFSYAIAGFLIDLMYVFMYLLFNLLSPYIGDNINLNATNPVVAIGFLGGAKLAANAAWSFGSVISSLLSGGIISQIITAFIGALIGGVVGGIATLGIGGLLTGAAAGVVGGFFGSTIIQAIGTAIAFIIISVALLTALFRLWFQLIKAYVSILINTVLAPFWIAGGLIPTSPLNFTNWVRDMAGNLAAFPATLAMFLFAKIFMEMFGANASPTNFVPPFVGNPGDQSRFGSLIGLGILLLTPNVVNLVRQAIKAPQGKLTAGLGQSISIGAGIVGSPVKGVGKHMWGVDPYTRQPRYFYGKFLDRFRGFASSTGALGKGWDKAFGGLLAVSGISRGKMKERWEE